MAVGEDVLVGARLLELTGGLLVGYGVGPVEFVQRLADFLVAVYDLDRALILEYIRVQNYDLSVGGLRASRDLVVH